MAVSNADIRRFDIISYLDNRGIRYWTSGRNVQRGWVNVTCPFCGDHSYSGNNHLGVDLKTNLFNCWICREKGSVLKLVVSLDHCTYERAENILRSFQLNIVLDNDIAEYKTTKVDRGGFDPVLPQECSDEFLELHLRYLRSRNFDPNYLIPKYKLKATHNLGEWKFRIIAPVFIDNRLVTFATRDVTGKSGQPHKSCPDERSIIPIKHCLYNLNTVKKKIIVCEGIADVWRIGDGSVSTFGYGYIPEQVELIVQMMVSECFILFDAESEADDIAEEIAAKLKLYIDHVEIVELDDGDPADMKEDDVRAMRRDFGL